MLAAIIFVIVLFCINPIAGIFGIIFLFGIPITIAIISVKKGWNIPSPKRRRKSSSLGLLKLFCDLDRGINKMAKPGYHSSKLMKSTRRK